MLALRNVACSDRWRQAWKQIRKQWGQQTQAQRACASAHRLLGQQDQPGLALALQALTDQGPSSSPISPASVSPLTKDAGPGSPTREVMSPAESFSSAQLKQERASAKNRRPASTHPWRRPFLRQRPAS
jgi:hypothetical protein